MQIKELTLPPNQKKITYQINKKGQTQVYISPKKPKNKPSLEWDMSKIHLGQLNSIQITQHNQLQNILEKNPYEREKKSKQPKIQINEKREICCSCKKSKCLKMYCQCFASKLFCTAICGCKSCTNTQINAQKLLFIHEQADIKRSPEDRGCKCTKSGCNKKYCHCYNNNKKCGQSCACTNCENIDPAVQQKKKMKQ